MSSVPQLRYVTHSHRFALEIIEQVPAYKEVWSQFETQLSSITEDEVRLHFEGMTREGKSSISESINKILDSRLTSCTPKWDRQSPIFADPIYNDPSQWKNWWTLDFARVPFSLEVAFNHGEATAWNLIKPVLASELNHVEKGIQTNIGIIVCATSRMKKAGGFDGSVGTYEKFLKYLKPFNNLLTVPMVLVGLKAPTTFHIKGKKVIPGPYPARTGSA